jgi:DNA-binding transcriptional regulator YhcF (GntR family)
MSDIVLSDLQSEYSQHGSPNLRGTLPEEQLLYDRLVDALIDKSLRPGQHLNEAKLAASYSVPRSRVRRVLERLRDEAVVEFQLNRGAFISRPTVEEVNDVFEARRNLEVIIVRLACARAMGADVERLRAHLNVSRQRLTPEVHERATVPAIEVIWTEIPDPHRPWACAASGRSALPASARPFRTRSTTHRQA